jgi:hypothetical protein
MEKQKEKPKTKRWTKPTFDFISAYPIDLCVHLLSSQDGQAQHYPLSPKFLPPSSEFSVEILPNDEDSCEFRMKWRDKRHPGYVRLCYASANGYLKRWDSKSTHVVGRVQVARWYAILNLTGWLALIVFFITFDYPFTRQFTQDSFILCLPPMWTAIIAINLYRLFRVRHKMLGLLEDILQPIPETNINRSRTKT